MTRPPKRRRPQYLWMMVTRDEYELPLYWADTAAELAEIVGTTKMSILTAVSHEVHGRSWSRYKRVRIDNA